MPEKAPEKIEETTRKYMREAEDVAQNAFRMGNDLMSTTINYYFDTFGKVIRHSMEITTHTQHATEDMMSIYRRMYGDNMKNWQEYLNDVTRIVMPPAK